MYINNFLYMYIHIYIKLTVFLSPFTYRNIQYVVTKRHKLKPYPQCNVNISTKLVLNRHTSFHGLFGM